MFQWCLYFLKRFARLEKRLRKLEKKVSDLQTTIDAETTKVTLLITEVADASQQITTGFATLEKEIADLKLTNPGGNFTGLDDALATVKTGADKLAGLVPADALPVVTSSGSSASGTTATPAI